MKNSIEMCQPLCMPFVCFGFDSRYSAFPEKPYMHYFAELLLVREGRLRVLRNQEEQIVSPGEAVLFCPAVVHQVSVAGDEPARVDVIRMDPDRMPDLPAYSADLKTLMWEASKANLPMLVPAADVERMFLSQLFDGCVQECSRRTYGYDVNVTSLMALINTAVIRFWKEKGLETSYRKGQTDPIYSLSGYIQAHLQDSLRVEDLAARCGLSYPWFAKKFREIYGISCKDYIEQIRVARVEEFLLFTDLDLMQISEMTGYADCSHMIKNFKRIMNITPGQYRLKNR